MKKYYCPYCNTKYQFAKKLNNGALVCGLCGDPLVKKPFVKINQIISIVASLSLILPLIYTFVFLIKNQINPTRRNYQANKNLIKKRSKSDIKQYPQNDFIKNEQLSSFYYYGKHY